MRPELFRFAHTWRDLTRLKLERPSLTFSFLLAVENPTVSGPYRLPSYSGPASESFTLVSTLPASRTPSLRPQNRTLIVQLFPQTDFHLFLLHQSLLEVT